jgi:hypothetical protein
LIKLTSAKDGATTNTQTEAIEMFIKYTAMFKSGSVQRCGTIITEIPPDEWDVVNYRFQDENGNNLSDDGELVEILDTEEMSF